MVASLVPPGPVAVSVTAVLPPFRGVPVILPVVVLIFAQLGSPVADQLVTGRFVLSVSEKVLLNAFRIAPGAVCPAVMIGTPSVIVKAILVAAPVPYSFVPVNEAVNEPFVVGVPEINPLAPFNDNPAGKLLPVANSHELIVPV